MKWTLDKGSVLWEQRASQRAMVDPDDDADLQGEEGEEEEGDSGDIEETHHEMSQSTVVRRPKRTKKRNPKGDSRVNRRFQRVLASAQRVVSSASKPTARSLAKKFADFNLEHEV
jgi:hypothetical protein